jgi:hypothetical protein
MKKEFEILKGQAKGKTFFSDERVQSLPHLKSRGYIKELKSDPDTKEEKHIPHTKEIKHRKRVQRNG